MKRYVGFLSKPIAPYRIITFSVGLLSGLGIVMVLSASAVKSFEQTGSSYSIFLKQLLFFTIAIASLNIASRMKIEIWQKIGKIAIPLAIFGLLMPQLPIIGKEINGNKSWIALGPFTLQPAEFAKLLLILFIATRLVIFEKKVERYKNGLSDEKMGPWSLIVDLAPGMLAMLVLIMAGKDLGTALIVGGIGILMIYLCGTPMRQMFVVLLGALLAAGALVVTQPHRVSRFAAFLHPFDPEVYKFAGWQTAHSVMGLASGGFFGVGLGASKQKWGNLSEANTDFIFSVIGEELGLLGTLAVLFTFGALIYGILRTAINTKNHFEKFAVAGIGSWLLLQVIVNVASDIGVFPVIGVTLPFISYGGSSLIANYLGIAFVLNVLRRDPAIREELTHAKHRRAKAVKEVRR